MHEADFFFTLLHSSCWLKVGLPSCWPFLLPVGDKTYAFHYVGLPFLSIQTLAKRLISAVYCDIVGRC